MSFSFRNEKDLLDELDRKRRCIEQLQKERDEALAELRKSGEAFRDIQDFYCDTARGGNPNFAYDKSTGALSLPLMKKVLESGG